MRLDVRTLDRQTAEAVAHEVLDLESDLSWERWTPAQLLDERSGKWTYSKVAYASGRVVGVAVASVPFSGTVHLHRLVVDERHRGGGVGRALIEDLRRCVAEGGHSRLTLKVAVTNTAAVGFYLSLGFRRVTEEQENLLMELAGLIPVAEGGA